MIEESPIKVFIFSVLEKLYIYIQSFYSYLFDNYKNMNISDFINEYNQNINMYHSSINKFQERAYYFLVVLAIFIAFRLIKRLILEIKILKELLQLPKSYSKKAMRKIFLKTHIANHILISKYKTEYLKFWDENNPNDMNNEKNIDPDKILTDKQYHYYIKTLRRHVYYKEHYIKDVILWMTSLFWAPGFFASFFNPPYDIIDYIIYSFGACCAFMFLFWWLLTPTFIMGVLIYPAIKRTILFNNTKTPLNERLLYEIGYHSNEHNNFLSVLGGTWIGKWI